MREKSHYHKPYEVDWLVHATYIAQESRYRVDLTRVDIVKAIISQVDLSYVSIFEIDLVIVETTVFDLNEFDVFRLSELNIVVLEWNYWFLQVYISFLIPSTFNVHEESIVNILSNWTTGINLTTFAGHLIQLAVGIVCIVKVGVYEGEAHRVVLEILIYFFITPALLVFWSIRTLLKHDLDVAEWFTIEVSSQWEIALINETVKYWDAIHTDFGWV